MEITIYDSHRPLFSDQEQAIVDFLYLHLGKYGDPRTDIFKAIDYAISPEVTGRGGFVCTASEYGNLIGAVVVNRTGMEGYIPENILVYIAVHADFRHRGIGRRLLNTATGYADGCIALHVEPDNPARFLYQSAGFTHKYNEMRLTRKEEV